MGNEEQRKDIAFKYSRTIEKDDPKHYLGFDYLDELMIFAAGCPKEAIAWAKEYLNEIYPEINDFFTEEIDDATNAVRIERVTESWSAADYVGNWYDPEGDDDLPEFDDSGWERVK
jgi:hypothetical protein